MEDEQRQREWCHIDQVEIKDLLERSESKPVAPNEKGRSVVQYDLKSGAYVLRQEHDDGRLSYWRLDGDDSSIVLVSTVPLEELPPTLLTRIYPCWEKLPTFLSKKELQRVQSLDSEKMAVDESRCRQAHSDAGRV